MFSANTSQIAAGGVNYIEDVFSTYLYTGNGSTQTITNGIDLSTKGGLLWMKSRSAVAGHILYDTASNATLRSDTTGANSSYYPTYINPTSSGFFLDASAGGGFNTNAVTYASWTFREAPKFFDIVTWTADSSGTGQAVSHNLGSIPGCIIVKATNASSNWFTWHIATGITVARTGFELNSTAASALSVNSTGQMTSTEFFSGQIFDSSYNRPVTDGTTYVAYLFAHNAGGFGLTGTDNVISCGSATASAGTWTDVNVGFEPQWVLIKNSTATGSYNPSGSAGSQDWYVIDTMRGATAATGSNTSTVALSANSSIAEYNDVWFGLTSTGFSFKGVTGGSDNFIYIAIRRGPMKVPTSGTSVFSPNRWTSTVGSSITTNFPLDLQISKWMGAGGDGNFVQDRLRGLNTVTTNSAQPYLFTESTAAEGTNSGANYNFGNTGFLVGDNDSANGWAVNFRRAPSFFDEVCWTGTGSGSQAITHNLGVAPEFTITKRRSGTGNWSCFPVMFGVNTGIYLDSSSALQTNSALHPTLPTATTYYTNDASWGDENIGGTFVTYLFATCAGVSKVGSYTGTATTLQVDCGFTGGARFVLIKRTDSTGSWYVWDVARGISSGNDPYLLLNSTAAEVTNTDYVDTYSAGFEISSTAPAAINASGGSFIFLAIA